jgi:CRP-like cAMP-binding protein
VSQPPRPDEFNSTAPFVIPPTFRVAEASQDTLLTVIELHLAEHCRAVELSPEVVVVKLDHARRYLTLSPAQWQALKTFGASPGRSVPQVLFKLIMDRGCIPLREFYEIVLKAHAAGILQTNEATPPPTVTPASWSTEIPGALARSVALVCILAGIVAPIVRPMPLPGTLLEILGGWVLACLTTSLGNWLGAGVLRRAHAEVYAPRFIWKTPLPRFTADLDDAPMGGGEAMVNVNLIRLAPGFVTLALTSFLAPGLALPAFLGVLAALSPFWWSPGLALMHALYGRRRNDATWRFQFEPNRAVWRAFTTWLRHTHLRFVSIYTGYLTVWSTIAILAAIILVQANAAELWQSFRAAGGLHTAAIVALALVGAGAATLVGILAYVGYLAWQEWRAERRRRALRPLPARATLESIRQLVDYTLLFQPLPDADRAAIAQAIRVEQFPAQATVIQAGDSGDRLYILFSGKVEIVRQLANSREERVAMLIPGDVFGEIALLNGGRRTRNVRTLEKTLLLSLTYADFAALALPKVSREHIENSIQKVAFLQRIPLACDWSPHAMGAFSRRTTFQDFAEGSYIIREGDDNQFFYLLYEGQLIVKKGRTEVALLGPGDFFGEISLLQNSLAQATIVTRTPCRCLIMNKREFIQFLAKDFTVGLRFEEISSQRLGQPIFPLRGKSFDVLRG